MTNTRSIALRGAPGSPYTRKMLAVLRYRRIPHRFRVGLWAGDEGLPRPKVDLLPTFYFESAAGVEAVVDSTPIIRRLEEEYFGRSVVPDDPALAFIDYLLEDYADEWLTKPMFHYRWRYPADIAKAGEILPRWRNLTAGADAVAPRARAVRERQIGRLYVVGSNEVTGDVIEDSYRRFLGRMDDCIGNGPFLFGGRPAAADFGLFGQLTQLAAFDPTPSNLTARAAPRVLAWVQIVDDLSGLEPSAADWFDRAEVPDTLTALLAEVGRTYVPVMLANARAIETGADEVAAQVDGRPWVQRPFPYQAKCLHQVRQEYARLDGAARTFVDRILADTGCSALFRRSPSL